MFASPSTTPNLRAEKIKCLNYFNFNFFTDQPLLLLCVHLSIKKFIRVFKVPCWNNNFFILFIQIFDFLLAPGNGSKKQANKSCSTNFFNFLIPVFNVTYLMICLQIIVINMARLKMWFYVLEQCTILCWRNGPKENWRNKFQLVVLNRSIRCLITIYLKISKDFQTRPSGGPKKKISYMDGGISLNQGWQHCLAIKSKLNTLVEGN